MNLTVIGSGSLGNAYLLGNDEEVLLIECGVHFRDIKHALKFSFYKVVGCVLTHQHGDHSKAINDVMKAGINVFASEKTHEALGTTMHHRACMIDVNTKLTLGGFQIKAFEVDHNGIPCLGFLIYHKECGRTLFVTDAKYIPFTFDGLNNIIIEANFSPDIAKRKLGDRKFLYDRVIQSHFSLPDCIRFLNANDLSQVNHIILIHLSDGNSDEVLFRTEVTKATGKTVTVADNGLVIELNKTPF